MNMLVGAAAMPATAEARTYVVNCGSFRYLEYKPDAWSMGCTGGSLNIRGVRWKTYRSTRATATGRAWLRKPCGGAKQPECPDAGTYKAAARLTFTRVRTCNLGEAKLRYYSRTTVRVRYRRGNPFGHKPGWRTVRVTLPRGDGSCEFAP